MKSQLPMNVYNYGQTDYEIYTDFEYYTEGVKTQRPNRRMLKHIQPYMIMHNQNRELVQYLKRYAPYFKRFIQITNETLYKKGDNKAIVKKIKIKQSFLSYIMQSKNQIYDIFNEKRVRRIYKYKVLNGDEILKENSLFHNIKTLSGKYEIKLKDIDTNEIIEKNIKFTNNYGYFDNQKFITSLYGGLKSLFELQEEHYNVYDDFLNKLSQYFEQVNTQNNNDWNTYLKNEVQKMSKYLNSQEVDKIQQEYKEKFKQNFE